MKLFIDKGDIEILQKISENIEKEALGFKKELKSQLWRALRILDASIKQNLRKNSGLHVRSGSLLNSILSEVTEVNALELRGTIGPYNIPYAAIHELGGVIPRRFIAPRNKLALAWQTGNRIIFSKKNSSNLADYMGATRKGKAIFAFSKGHFIGPTTIPARPYLRPALEKNKDRIAEKFGLFLQTQFTFKGE